MSWGPHDIMDLMKTGRYKSAQVSVNTPQDCMTLTDTGMEGTLESMAFHLDQTTTPLNYFYSMFLVHTHKNEVDWIEDIPFQDMNISKQRIWRKAAEAGRSLSPSTALLPGTDH